MGGKSLIYYVGEEYTFLLKVALFCWVHVRDLTLHLAISPLLLKYKQAALHICFSLPLVTLSISSSFPSWPDKLTATSTRSSRLNLSPNTSETELNHRQVFCKPGTGTGSVIDENLKEKMWSPPLHTHSLFWRLACYFKYLREYYYPIDFVTEMWRFIFTNWHVEFLSNKLSVLLCSCNYGRSREAEECHQLSASLGYSVTSRPTWLESGVLLQTKPNQSKRQGMKWNQHFRTKCTRKHFAWVT